MHAGLKVLCVLLINAARTDGFQGAWERLSMFFRQFPGCSKKAESRERHKVYEFSLVNHFDIFGNLDQTVGFT